MENRLRTSFQRYLNGANKKLVTFLGIVVVFHGCATHLSRPMAPTPNLQQYKTFYVVQSDIDSRGIYKVIQNELTLLGKDVKTGPRSSMPTSVDAIVTYHDDWKWDLTWYLLNLLIQFRDPKTNVLLASAASFRTSLARTEPELMAREVLEAILK